MEETGLASTGRSKEETSLRRIIRSLERQLGPAQEKFEEYAEEHGFASALDWKLPSCRKAQGFDDYTLQTWKAAQVLKEGDGSFKKVKKVASEELDRIRKDAVQNHLLREPHNGQDAYREGRGNAADALNDVIYHAQQAIES